MRRPLRAGWRVQTFWHLAKTLPQGEFTSPEDSNPQGLPKASLLGVRRGIGRL